MQPRGSRRSPIRGTSEPRFAFDFQHFRVRTLSSSDSLRRIGSLRSTRLIVFVPGARTLREASRSVVSCKTPRRETRSLTRAPADFSRSRAALLHLERRDIFGRLRTPFFYLRPRRSEGRGKKRGNERIVAAEPDLRQYTPTSPAFRSSLRAREPLVFSFSRSPLVACLVIKIN